jgi:hypothetical protein
MQKMKIHLRSDTRFFLSTLEPAESCYIFAVTKLCSPSYPGPVVVELSSEPHNTIATQ